LGWQIIVSFVSSLFSYFQTNFQFDSKQETLEPINPVTAPQLTGLVALVDKIYPEWSNTNHNWQDVQDSEEYVKFPRELSHHGVQSVRTLLNLDSSESKVKSKGDAKKGKETPFEGTAEALIDDEGRRLPRIVCCDDGSLNDYSRPLLFMRTASNEQTERTYTLESSSYDAKSEDLTKNDVAVVSIGVSGALGEGSNAVEVSKRSEGEEIDSCMCAAFRIIAEFARKNSIYTAELNPSDNRAPNSRFLWNSIYPQLCTGRPVYNPTGKYSVRLFLGGKWRKVQVTDMVPIGSSGCAIARSAEPYELWPLLLSKAVYSVYTACG
jgi:Calpain family cysteine protease